jgi:C-terminal processing protease CtpA/Prc
MEAAGYLVVKDHPNTTQMGTPTGGVNSLMESYRLPNTGLLLVVGWSAKFRPNGKLYDGTGIPPDIFMAATPQDLVGETDTVLDAAVRRLKENGGTNPMQLARVPSRS